VAESVAEFCGFMRLHAFFPSGTIVAALGDVSSKPSLSAKSRFKPISNALARIIDRAFFHREIPSTDHDHQR
jgi:hypothetical protein